MRYTVCTTLEWVINLAPFFWVSVYALLSVGRRSPTRIVIRQYVLLGPELSTIKHTTHRCVTFCCQNYCYNNGKYNNGHFCKHLNEKNVGYSYHWDSKLTRLRGDRSCVFPSRSEDNWQVLFLFPNSLGCPSKLCPDLLHTNYPAIDRNFCSVQYNTFSWFCYVALRSKHAKNWQRITKS